MQIRLSGSNIRLATCEMAAQIHFHARHLHVFSGRKGDEPCQPPLGPRYPINPGLTCGVLGSRTRKVEKCPTIQRRSIEEGGDKWKRAGGTMGARKWVSRVHFVVVSRQWFGTT